MHEWSSPAVWASSGSSLARRLVALGAKVLLIDSVIPEYGGNPTGISDIRDQVVVDNSDIRGGYALHVFSSGQKFLFNAAAQTGHLEPMIAPEDDLAMTARSATAAIGSMRCRQSRYHYRSCGDTTDLWSAARYLPVDERHPLQPVDVNGVNKMAGEAYHLLYRDVYGIKSRSLRLTNVYGPGMRIKDARQNFLGIWLRRVIEVSPSRCGVASSVATCFMSMMRSKRFSMPRSRLRWRG